jgi:hypothetical protein
MLTQMKKTLSILRVVGVLILVTAAAVSAGPVVIKETKTVIIIAKYVTKCLEYHYSKAMADSMDN